MGFMVDKLALGYKKWTSTRALSNGKYAGIRASTYRGTTSKGISPPLW
jgi:hypothetical protein